MLGWYLVPNVKAGVCDEDHLPGQLEFYLFQGVHQLLQRISLADKQSFLRAEWKFRIEKVRVLWWPSFF